MLTVTKVVSTYLGSLTNKAQRIYVCGRARTHDHQTTYHIAPHKYIINGSNRLEDISCALRELTDTTTTTTTNNNNNIYLNSNIPKSSIDYK